MFFSIRLVFGSLACIRTGISDRKSRPDMKIVGRYEIYSPSHLDGFRTKGTSVTVR